MVGSAMIRSGGRQQRDALMGDPPDQLVYRLPEPFEVFYEREYHGPAPPDDADQAGQ